MRQQRAHPRSRGENQSRTTAHLSTVGSSPLTRGKLARLFGIPPAKRLIPAHAGKTALSSQFSLGEPAHPRSRGENADADAMVPWSRGSSPLTRGKLSV